MALAAGVTIATIAIFRNDRPEPPPRPFNRLDYVYSAGARIRPVAAEVIGGDYHKPFEWRGRKFSCFPSDHAALLVTYEIVPAE